MTLLETAAALRRLAEVYERIAQKTGNVTDPLQRVKCQLTGNEEIAVGAGLMLIFARDILTISGKDVFTRDELLVILETFSRDDELFPHGAGKLLWDMEEESDENHND